VNTEILRGLAGIVVLLGIAWLASEQRRTFPVRTILFGLAAQVGLAFLLTRVPAVTAVFGAIAHMADGLQQASAAGTKFMFGYLGGGSPPFADRADGAGSSFIFAFQALPAFLVVSALSAMLWHWRILIGVVRGAAWLFGRAFGVSGPVGVSVSACIFLGLVEAPLLVRPLLPKLSRGELFIIMVDGLSVVAGSTMILLATLLAPRLPDAFRHLLIASVISTPMAIAMAKAMVPTGPVTNLRVELESPYRSTLDALTQGTLGAIRLVANIAGLLIVFVSLIALLNMALSWLPHDGTPLTLGFIMGKLLLPVTWLMGIPLPDLEQAGALLGTKVVANEVVAYSDLLALPPGLLQSKTETILT
jgi:CNT family concentrative nucleoside transporter